MLFKKDNLVDGFKIPSLFKNKISITSTCDLDNETIRLFNIALQETFEQIYHVELFNDPNFKIMKVNIIFTNDGSFGVKESNGENIYGKYMSFIIYKMDMINAFDDELLKMFVFVEELAHHYWQIDDEVEVKFKVIEILKRYNETIEITPDGERWKVTWKKKR